MQHIITHKTKIILVVLVLNFIVTSYFVISLRVDIETTQKAIQEVAQVLGKSGIVSKGADGELIINRVITLADLQTSQLQ